MKFNLGGFYYGWYNQKKYKSELMTYQKKFTRPLTLISTALPLDYNKNTILNMFIDLYPLQWKELTQRYELYSSKDRHLQSVGKKKRYYHDEPESFFFNLAKVKHLVSAGQYTKHKKSFNFHTSIEEYKKLATKRDLKIKIHTEKINITNQLIQSVEPLYIDIFISSYHNRGVTTKDKIEILNEIKKFNCAKSIEFFQKLNDSERKNQVRRMAFEHLQKIREFVRLRKKHKGKIKFYTKERDGFNMTPKDLVERIEADSIQNKKSYDIFISHSFLDLNLVLNLKNNLNEHNLTVYCDWTSDDDFLKRSLASEYTEIVLKKRIEQSNVVLFLKTNNSMSCNGEILSKWVEMEINFARKLTKPIYCLNLSGGCSPFKSIRFDIENELLSLSEIDINELSI